MKLRTLVVAGAFAIVASAAFAQNSTGSSTGAPGAGPTPSTGERGGMREQNTGMDQRSSTNQQRGPGTNTYQGGPNNSTGNMNTKGGGAGTTGTGGPGGSGNE